MIHSSSSSKRFLLGNMRGALQALQSASSSTIDLLTYVTHDKCDKYIGEGEYI